MLSEPWPVLAALLGVALALAPAIALWATWRTAARLLRRHWHEPLWRRCILLTGIAGGCLALATILAAPISGLLGAGAIFITPGQWRLTGPQLLLDRLPELLLGMIRLFAAPLGLLNAPALAGALGFLGALAAIAVLVRRTRAPSWRVMAAIALAFGTGATVLYLVSVALWLVAALNFWLLALILLAYQHWRHAKASCARCGAPC